MFFLDQGWNTHERDERREQREERDLSSIQNDHQRKKQVSGRETNNTKYITSQFDYMTKNQLTKRHLFETWTLTSCQILPMIKKKLWLEE